MHWLLNLSKRQEKQASTQITNSKTTKQLGLTKERRQTHAHRA